MKRVAMVTLAALVISSATYLAYTYFEGNQAIGKAAVKISDISERVSFEDLGPYFAGYKGAFVLFDKNKNEYVIYDEAQSQQRVSPCSTFKIVNSLIGLETGVLADENTVFKWDGKQNSIKEWNKDQTMTSAFRNSVVWYYQELASRVGKERMQDYLTKLNYGNADMSGGLTKFWLVSSLKISPLEQVIMLRRFYSDELPFSSRNVDIVKRVMVQQRRDEAVLSGKTGYAGSGLGWFVGYVERNNNVYFFATNAQGKNLGPGKASEITLKILADRKLF